MNRAVFFDIDGTILDSFNGQKEMSAAVSKAIYRLQEQGDYAFIATGRPYSFITDYFFNFGFDGFLLNNGAHIIMNGKTLYKKPLDRAFVQEVVAALEEMNIQYILQGENYSYLKEEFNAFDDFFSGVGIHPSKLLRRFNLAEVDVFKIEVLCPKEEDQAYCTKILEAHPEYTYFFSISKVVCEIHAKESTKGTGILKVLELLDIPVERSYAFGDGENDIEMLETVGCGIAMDNAVAEVKEHASKVTASVKEDGVAKGIATFIFNEESEMLCS